MCSNLVSEQKKSKNISKAYITYAASIYHIGCHAVLLQRLEVAEYIHSSTRMYDKVNV